MKVYKIDSGGSAFKRIAPIVHDRPQYEYFNGQPLLANWQPMDVHDVRPDKEDFDLSIFMGFGAIIVTREAKEKLRHIFDAGGVELLPLPFEDKIYNIVNVIELIDRPAHSSEKYAFLADRITKPLFKIKVTTSISPIYMVERTADPNKEFKAAVQHYGLRGIRFEKVWTDQTAEEVEAELVAKRPLPPPGICDLVEVIDYSLGKGERPPGKALSALYSEANKETLLFACHHLLGWLKTRSSIKEKKLDYDEFGVKKLNYARLHLYKPFQLGTEIMPQLIMSSVELRRLFQITPEGKGYVVDFRPEIDESQQAAIENYVRQRFYEKRE